MIRLKDMLIRHEGFRSKPYKCTAGKLTIGIGRNLEDRGISMDEALYMLDSDLNQAEIDLSKYEWFNQLDDIRKDVLRDMYINLGLPRLLGFKKMIAALQAKDYVKAANEMLQSRWAHQVKGRAYELADMMKIGRYVK